MMNHRISRLLIAACIALAALCSQGILHADQPHMDKAIELLQQAKKDANPIPLLEKAREHIRNAKPNKGGRRPDAIKAITEAIEVSKKGDSPESKINHAIAMIHSGKDRAN